LEKNISNISKYLVANILLSSTFQMDKEYLRFKSVVEGGFKNYKEGDLFAHFGKLT